MQFITGAPIVDIPSPGKAKQARKAIFRSKDTSQTRTMTLYHDENTIPEYRLTWHRKSTGEQVKKDWQKIDSTYIYLAPPELTLE